ncbi:MAG: hypothetical protein RBR67_04960 [Desulfobacterium sp.]|nr:hypothetical protein [Desulfobacterium sp.]
MDWHLSTLGVDHLFFDRECGAALEITWAGKFYPGHLETFMVRFARRVQKCFTMTVTPISSSLDRVDLDSKMEVAWFAWAIPASRGQGVLMGCRRCRRLFILRFFTDSTDMPDPWVERVVASFQENCGKGMGKWKLFGLELSTPGCFRLSSYLFRPGSFMVDFKAQGQRLTAHSWGPASFLLLKNDLETVARTRVSLPDTNPGSGGDEQCPFLVWEWEGGARPFAFMRQRHRFITCHNLGGNRIIALKSSTRGGYGLSLLDLAGMIKGGFG